LGENRIFKLLFCTIVLTILPTRLYASDIVMTITGNEETLEFASSDFKSITTGLDARVKEHVVFFRFTPDAATIFAKFTYANVGKILEIRVCGDLIIKPRIMSAIYGGAGRLTNLQSEARADEVAKQLRTGNCN